MICQLIDLPALRITMVSYTLRHTTRHEKQLIMRLYFSSFPSRVVFTTLTTVICFRNVQIQKVFRSAKITENGMLLLLLLQAWGGTEWGLWGLHGRGCGWVAKFRCASHTGTAETHDESEWSPVSSADNLLCCHWFYERFSISTPHSRLLVICNGTLLCRSRFKG